MQHSSSTSVKTILKILHSLHLLSLVIISLHHRVEHFVGLQLCLHSTLQKECIPNEICSCPISKQEHIDLQVQRFIQRPFPVQLITFMNLIMFKSLHFLVKKNIRVYEQNRLAYFYILYHIHI